MTVYQLKDGPVVIENGTATRWDGVTAPATPGLVASLSAVEAAWIAESAADTAIRSARQALADVLALAALYPFGTVEETAIVDTQAAAALASYRALTDPPADVVSLAAAVVAWRVAL